MIGADLWVAEEHKKELDMKRRREWLKIRNGGILEDDIGANGSVEVVSRRGLEEV